VFFGQRPAFFGLDLCSGIEISAFMSDEFDGLDATEKAGIGATLIRCRVLAAKIANELRNERPEQFVDKLLLADLYASLEHAARSLNRKDGRFDNTPTPTTAVGNSRSRYSRKGQAATPTIGAGVNRQSLFFPDRRVAPRQA